MEAVAKATHVGRGRCPEDCRQLAHVWLASRLATLQMPCSGQRVLDAAGPLDAAPAARLRALAYATQARLDLTRGRLDEAVAAATDCLRANRPNGRGCLRATAHIVLSTCALRKGDTKTAFRIDKDMRDDALLGNTGVARLSTACMVAQITEIAIGPTAAEYLLEGLASDTAQLHSLITRQPDVTSWLVRTANRLGNEQISRRTVSSAGELAAGHPQFRVFRASALHAAGLTDKDPAQLCGAAELYADPWLKASALEDVAVLLSARRSDHASAVGFFKEASQGYAATGAVRDVSRVANRLRAFGVRCRAACAESGPDTALPLTSAESAVADLTSQGLTNTEVGKRLFISPHTVAHHLRSIFRKLNISSRVQLALIWNSHAPVPEGVRART
ncbi:helix-turn-helix transcriptional regulator [Streptomyces roseirectus]|uniref:Helix-turn-helix transcriptional regulator n=1 Tax=Streptomyces roseirectus TaxID=2768066 RepID=A0A7H0IQM8_9ACTN|nr:helix-turn-helix transcriptional regulator [Streptomyces roseirectus]QNP75094.1 helix-turn-helix transcriptional regulator [Streptomyces roseirectus]